MFTIRNAQLALLSAPFRQRFIDALIGHLRTYFPDHMASWDEEALYRLTARAMTQAAALGLSSTRQVCQFLNVCALYGWDCWEQREHQWMLDEYLRNPAIPDPQERLARLVDQCLWRLEVEAHNANVRREIDQEQRRKAQQREAALEEDAEDILMDKAEV